MKSETVAKVVFTAVVVGAGIVGSVNMTGMDLKGGSVGPSSAIIEPCIWPKCSRPVLSSEFVINLN